MPQDPQLFDTSDVSYSYRARPETAREVIANRVGVTASLFAAAMGLSYLLGRRRS
ncbi:hypothetical protein [Amnibacterium endophyticum]|uniref:Uncharacterized protein n=1 Tax=Amnibacterium endophyticum TaxID=2109337 RepID=A0ABW4LE40_9MICO